MTDETPELPDNAYPPHWRTAANRETSTTATEPEEPQYPSTWRTTRNTAPFRFTTADTEEN
jgi:hypothetical protein